MLRGRANEDAQKGENVRVIAPARIPNRKYKTCRRYNDPGDAHALTFSCFHGRAFFSKERACRWLVESLQRARQRRNSDLWAYVIMPEHCHVLVFPRNGDYSISRILESIHARIEYIHNNPVRRGLMTRAEQWPWSTAAWDAGARELPLVPDMGSIPPLHPK